MPYVQIPEKTNTFKVEFLKLDAQRTIIRILDKEPHTVFTHFVNNTTVECLGTECPICHQNIKLWAENNSTGKNVKSSEIKGYAPKRFTVVLNVLNRTKGKVCPGCGKFHPQLQNGQYLPMCNCGTPLATVEAAPLNKVQLLSKGKEFAEQLNGLETLNLDNDGNMIPLTSYDLTIVKVSDKKINVAASMPFNNDPVEYKQEDLFDPKRAYFTLTPDEIIKMQSGIAVKDLFAARRTQQPAVNEVEDNTASKFVEDMQDQIEKELFG